MPPKAAPRLARPAQRYFPGKAPKGANIGDSDSDSDAEQNDAQEELAVDVPISGDFDDADGDEDEDLGAMKNDVSKKLMNVSLKNVNISAAGKVIVDGRAESGKTAVELEQEAEESEEEEAGKPGDEEEGSSSEYETDSEEDAPKAPAFRPVFIPKRGRVTVAERESEAQNTEEAQRKREEEAEKRKKESHDLVAESIKRELAEKEVQEVVPDVDDTDGLDPTAEFEDWRLRELGRIKRDKEAAMARQLEREEIERRRALPEAQRLAEDMKHANKTRDDKPKGQQKFLQKYYHKGAFHQDESILKRDYTQATESTVDVSMLPKVMQVRNFGKRSQTKYTHLLDQDTTRSSGGFGGSDSKARGPGAMPDGQGCFNCGGPHLKKDCPNLDQSAGPSSTSFGRGTGVNQGFAAAKPTRQWGVRKAESDLPSRSPPRDAPSGPRGWGKERDEGRDRSRRSDNRGDERNDRQRSWRSRSRSPRRDGDRDSRGGHQREKESWRDRDEGRRRARSRSRTPERSDKRRRRD